MLPRILPKLWSLIDFKSKWVISYSTKLSNHHHHYHKGFNKTATPLFSNIQNQLRFESKMATTHLGQPFVHAAMKLRGESNFFNVILLLADRPTSFIVILETTTLHVNQKASNPLSNLNQTNVLPFMSRNLKMYLVWMPMYPLKLHAVGVWWMKMTNIFTINFSST